MRDLSVRTLGLADLDDVASIHCAAFPNNAFTRMGGGAVRRYYEYQMRARHELYPIGAFAGGAMAGFCFGGIVPSAIGGFLSKNRGFLARRLLARPWLAADPLFAGWLGKGVRHALSGRKVRAAAAPSTIKRPFDILAIAVHPIFRRYGAGRALMQRSRELALANGFHVMTLFVEPANESAVAFYRSLGWQKLERNGTWRGNMELWFDGRTLPTSSREQAVANNPFEQM